jgi:hypothetical protein
MTSHFIIDLLDLVRQHPELYDSSHRLYRDEGHKKRVWTSIGQALNNTGRIDDCQLCLLNCKHYNISHG